MDPVSSVTERILGVGKSSIEDKYGFRCVSGFFFDLFDYLDRKNIKKSVTFIYCVIK